MSDKLLVADLPDGSPIFACVDPSARFCEARLGNSRLAAALHPFAAEVAARAALEAAGAADAREWRK